MKYPFSYCGTVKLSDNWTIGEGKIVQIPIKTVRLLDWCSIESFVKVSYILWPCVDYLSLMTWRIFQNPIPTPKWQNSTENCLSEYLRCSVGLHTTLTHVDLHTTQMHEFMYTLAQLQPV